MAFSQSHYINEYNKANYKVYSFRVKKSDEKLIKYLDNKTDRNKLIISLLQEEAKKYIFTLQEIKNISKPIFKKYEVKEAFLFGSYSRNQANENSDIDFFYRGIKEPAYKNDTNLWDELKEAFGKEIDLVYKHDGISKDFIEEIEKDFIKIY